MAAKKKNTAGTANKQKAKAPAKKAPAKKAPKGAKKKGSTAKKTKRAGGN